MKRGKDDEKIVEPLFPRLHVNDADKGGPRAPPRNKMALYEQLSVPSQRFNRHGLLPLNPHNTSSLVPPGSSSQSQVCGMVRNLYFQHQVSSSVPVHPAEKFVAQKSHVANVSSSALYDQRKIVGEEDDFMVPVFVNSGRAQSSVRGKTGIDKENPPPLIPTSSYRFVETQEVSVRDSKQNGSLSACSRQGVRNMSSDNPKQGAPLNHLDLSAREEVAVDKSTLQCDVLNDSNACLSRDSRNRFYQDGGKTGVKDTDNGVDSRSRSRSHSEDGHSSPDEVDNAHESCRSKTYASLQQRNGEVSDGVSETSMVDSISGRDISPDDVVELIGQQRFWKARRAIANQQRIFAVQVFELHRLIKVQRLIAATPHILLDDGTFLVKSFPKTSPVKKIVPPEYAVDPLPQVVMHKDDSEQANNSHHRIECSAENAVARATTVSSGRNNNVHPSPLVGHPPPPVATDAQMTGGGGGWCFPPQPLLGNHQWLIPVMSPSEGLIYKPYPGPGLIGSVCGGYFGHFVPTPIPAGDFVGSQAYGVPAPSLPYHQSVGFPAAGLSYFPPIGVPAPNANFPGEQHNEQTKQFGHTDNPPVAAMAARQQSFYNSPNAKNGDGAAAQPPPQPPSPTKLDRDSSKAIQGSTGSSPGDRRRERSDSVNAPPLIPTVFTADKKSHPESAAKRTAVTAKVTRTMPTATIVARAGPRVIRVVPHNRTVASETAARIFRSIQEERKQHESV